MEHTQQYFCVSPQYKEQRGVKEENDTKAREDVVGKSHQFVSITPPFFYWSLFQIR